MALDETKAREFSQALAATERHDKPSHIHISIQASHNTNKKSIIIIKFNFNLTS
jgi:hypothetical protein